MKRFLFGILLVLFVTFGLPHFAFAASYSPFNFNSFTVYSGYYLDSPGSITNVYFDSPHSVDIIGYPVIGIYYNEFDSQFTPLILAGDNLTTTGGFMSVSWIGGSTNLSYNYVNPFNSHLQRGYTFEQLSDLYYSVFGFRVPIYSFIDDAYRLVISPLSYSFDGSASIDGFTVKNISRYIQDLRYSVSFDEGTFEDKLSGSILENLAQLKIQTYYSLQCPSLSWLESTAASISNFDDWYSLRASVPQTTVCNNWVQYVYRPKDEYIKELPLTDNKRTNIANISSVTSQIYGRQLSDIEQKLFDVLCYPQTVGVRSTWLLSSLFGYGPLRIINIGPTLLNGRAINASGFSGDSSANGVNSYLWNDDTLTDSDQNDTDQVVPIGNSTSTGYPSETVINNNYNEYITYNNYYPTVSSGGIQNVYVVNYEDFTSNVTNSSNQEIINNYEFNFGDLNISSGITNAANEVNNSFSDLTSGDNGGVAKIGADFISVVPSDIAVVLFGIIGASIIALVINKMRS